MIPVLHSKCQIDKDRHSSGSSYLIYPINEAHEFAHAVAVVVRRPECIFSNQPSRWEYYKIKQRDARLISWRS